MPVRSLMLSFIQAGTLDQQVSAGLDFKADWMTKGKKEYGAEERNYIHSGLWLCFFFPLSRAPQLNPYGPSCSLEESLLFVCNNAATMWTGGVHTILYSTHSWDLETKPYLWFCFSIRLGKCVLKDQSLDYKPCNEPASQLTSCGVDKKLYIHQFQCSCTE